jgi:hypothetical protein
MKRLGLKLDAEEANLRLPPPPPPNPTPSPNPTRAAASPTPTCILSTQAPPAYIATHARTPSSRAKVAALYGQFDEDGSGGITYREMRHALSAHHTKLSELGGKVTLASPPTPASPERTKRHAPHPQSLTLTLTLSQTPTLPDPNPNPPSPPLLAGGRHASPQAAQARRSSLYTRGGQGAGEQGRRPRGQRRAGGRGRGGRRGLPRRCRGRGHEGWRWWKRGRGRGRGRGGGARL